MNEQSGEAEIPATTAWPSKPHLRQYLDFMHEIKRRDHVAYMTYREPSRVLFEPVVVDTCYLQFRKMLELIAHSVLLANVEELEKVNHPKDKDYNADSVLRRIESKFGNCYPQPIFEQRSSDSDMVDFQSVTEGFLTRNEFTSLYAKCGNVLHSRNPFRKQIDFDLYYSEIPMWISRIRTLLNKHIATIINDTDLYLIQMSGPDFESRPTLTRFGLQS